jgi:drug/metabolite transporter (DMT)-like permease
LAVGFIGVTLLASKQINGTGSNYLVGVAALMASSICWAFGSVFNRTARKPTSPLLGVAMQMMAGGGILLLLATVRGELKQFSIERVTALSFGAWLYLSIAGSLIAYTAYVWLLHVTTPARVSTNAYVNPLVAVLLGCTIGREAFTPELFLAGGLIVVAVALVLRGGSVKPTPTSQCEEVG